MGSSFVTDLLEKKGFKGARRRRCWSCGTVPKWDEEFPNIAADQAHLSRRFVGPV